MTDFTKSELELMLADQLEINEQNNTTIGHLQEVILLYINDLAEIELNAFVEDDEGENSVVYRLRKRAEIRRQISTRKSVQEGQPDRIADLLEEAATELEIRANAINRMYAIASK
jgi:hypothetical protein